MSHALKTTLITIATTFASVVASASSTADADEWRFNVLLDGKPIGHHTFQLTGAGGNRELISDARFSVKFLFVTAYRYAHAAREVWRDGCLDGISARTDDNGVRRVVNGSREGDHLLVTIGQQSVELPGCVLTFAYWNPEILSATRLLNPQTGEYVPVRIRHIGVESIVVRGARISADHYRLEGDATVGGKLAIELWYSTSNEWLALESKTEESRTLRYQRQ